MRNKLLIPLYECALMHDTGVPLYDCYAHMIDAYQGDDEVCALFRPVVGMRMICQRHRRRLSDYRD